MKGIILKIIVLLTLLNSCGISPNYFSQYEGVNILTSITTRNTSYTIFSNTGSFYNDKPVYRLNTPNQLIATSADWVLHENPDINFIDGITYERNSDNQYIYLPTSAITINSFQTNHSYGLYIPLVNSLLSSSYFGFATTNDIVNTNTINQVSGNLTHSSIEPNSNFLFTHQSVFLQDFFIIAGKIGDTIKIDTIHIMDRNNIENYAVEFLITNDMFSQTGGSFIIEFKIYQNSVNYPLTNITVQMNEYENDISWNNKSTVQNIEYSNSEWISVKVVVKNPLTRNNKNVKLGLLIYGMNTKVIQSSDFLFTEPTISWYSYL